LSRSEDARSQGRFAPADLPGLPGLPRDEAGPVFTEPWQAQAFALVLKLHEAGHFAWSEWSQALGAQLKAAAARGEPDDGTRYYEHWLAALEQVIQAKRVLDAEALRLRREAWARAYRATPHGKPVHLGAGERPDPT
jgi:nitrile hydratase accessory protein